MPAKVPQFVAEDVWRVAQAMLCDAVSERDHGRGGAYNTCQHCDERVWWKEPYEKIVHKPNCLVLVARDLLTGAPEEIING